MTARSTASAAALLCMVAGGCDSAAVSAAHQAERRVTMVERAGGTSAEICAAKRAVEQAWLNALDDAHYLSAKLAADLACNRALLESL